MGLKTNLQLRQTLGLTLTPQLLQSIKLLQMNQSELEQFLTSETEKNPFLEVKFGSGKASAQVPAGAAGGQWNDFDFKQVREQKNLRQHVLEQTALTFKSRNSLEIAISLCGNLDDDGYLRIDLVDFCKNSGIELERAKKVLAVCKQFDPPGIFARDLQECLVLQLQASGKLSSEYDKLLAHLDLVASRNFKALAKLCNVTPDKLAHMMETIRGLDPRPGHRFLREQTVTVNPDVVLTKSADGSWQVEIPENALPRILLNRSYARTISTTLKGDEKKFITDCMQSGNWLARSLNQRKLTILSVAGEIVRHQRTFFDDEEAGLRPLTLKTIAEAVGMHESTISRVTANKYIMTPRGLYELRHFFSGAIGSTIGGEAHASQSVREQIRKLIDQERSDDILSDDSLVTILQERGMDIARRTVAKYRESMGIPSSVYRRREKQLRADKA